MISVINAKWDLSKGEKYAINWLDEHNFDGELVKQYFSKTIFNVRKHGVSDRFELPQGINDVKMKKVMEFFEKSFEMKTEIENMKAKLNKI